MSEQAVALKRAQAYNETLTRHVLALIETVEQRGAPNASTLIAACERALRSAYEAGDAAATPGAVARGRDD